MTELDPNAQPTLKLNQLRESAFNHRRVFNEAEMAELTESIKQQGVLQPLLVRELPTAAQEIWVRYEVIAGARRFRAAKAAGLDEVPVMFKQMTDEEALVAQLTENVNRVNVSAVEEAEGYKALLDNHNATVDSLVLSTGKSRSHIYNTLSLLKLQGVARDLVSAGTVGREIGVLIARLPESMQKKAVDAITFSHEGKLTAMSFRQARSILQTKLYVALTEAHFDTTCEELAPRAGACTTCPSLSDNDPGLASELKPGLCTDPGCFGVKARVHAERVAAEHRAAGGDVLEGEAARDAHPHAQADWFIGYKRPHEVTLKTKDGKTVTADEALATLREQGHNLPTTLHIEPDTHKPTTLMSVEVLEQVRQLVEPPKDETSQHATRVTQYTEWASEAHRDAAENCLRIRQACQRACLTTERTPAELHLVVESLLAERHDIDTELLEHLGWPVEPPEGVHYYDFGEWLAEHHAPSLTLDQCSAVLVYLLLDSAPFGTSWSEERNQYAERIQHMASIYNVDIASVAKASAAERAEGLEDDEEIDDDATTTQASNDDQAEANADETTDTTEAA